MFANKLADHAGPGAIITWTYCNRGHQHMALNWWRHMERYAADAKPHVMCLDEESEAYLRARGVRTLAATPPFSISADEINFSSSVAWTQVMLMKLMITHEILAAGYSNFYSDTDVVARRDPRGTLESMMEGHEFLAQINHAGRICAGIYFVRPTPQTLRLFDLDAPGLPEYQLENPRYNDQLFIQERVAALGDDLRWGFLPAAGYPNGKTWYANRDKLRDLVEMIHYNCLIGSTAKIAEMITDGVWHAEDDTHQFHDELSDLRTDDRPE